MYAGYNCYASWNGKNFITPEGYLLTECYVM